MQLRGHDELRTVKFWPFQVHYSLNPLIEVHGDRAVGKWYFFRPHTTHENVARWAGGYYDDEYVRDEGVWKFESIRLTNWYLTPYDTGFAIERGAPPQLEEQYLERGVAHRARRQTSGQRVDWLDLHPLEGTRDEASIRISALIRYPARRNNSW